MACEASASRWELEFRPLPGGELYLRQSRENDWLHERCDCVGDPAVSGVRTDAAGRRRLSIFGAELGFQMHLPKSGLSC
ncbi:MAG: hypothetical protein E7029_00940 [Planctomycetaceae bacterium]|nr:hypothetical protein [Planctomycetaceae bacterium]